MTTLCRLLKFIVPFITLTAIINISAFLSILGREPVPFSVDIDREQSDVYYHQVAKEPDNSIAHVQHREGSNHTEQRKQTGSHPRPLMISTYMRSGSSFLGRVLGFREDTFYIYEPLWGYIRNSYFSTGGERCSTFSPDCTHSAGVETALEALEQIYSCTFYRPPMSAMFKNTNHKLAGKKWTKYRECLMKIPGSRTHCLQIMADTECSTSDFILTKTLRFSLEHTETLLRTIPNLKVVHLFRDPRAMIHSHSNTRWSPVRESSPFRIEMGAQTICGRIVKDVNYGEILRKRYPDRFKIIQYEDFQDPLATIKVLYKFLDMHFRNEILQYIDTGTNAGKNGNHPFTYRYSMEWNIIKIINKHCKEAFDLLGYRLFETENEFKDMSISAITQLKYKIS